MSVLIESPPPPAGDGQLHRLDVCHDAWSAGARPEAAPGARMIGTWRAVVSSADHPRRQALDAESMVELLQQIEPGDARRDAVRLVLAMLLLRNRTLASDGVSNGRLLLRPRSSPRPPEGPPHIEVADVGLDEATVADVMSELEPLLGLGGAADGSGS